LIAQVEIVIFKVGTTCALTCTFNEPEAELPSGSAIQSQVELIALVEPEVIVPVPTCTA